MDSGPRIEVRDRLRRNDAQTKPAVIPTKAGIQSRLAGKESPRFIAKIHSIDKYR